jgi:hypothetical protein
MMRAAANGIWDAVPRFPDHAPAIVASSVFIPFICLQKNRAAELTAAGAMMRRRWRVSRRLLWSEGAGC